MPIIPLTLLSACCGGGDDSNNAKTSPPPTPKRGLLLGVDEDNAVAKTLLLSPTPVNPSQIKVGGLLSTRLDAVINPAATVAEINTALESVGAKIAYQETPDFFGNSNLRTITLGGTSKIIVTKSLSKNKLIHHSDRGTQ